MKNTELSKYEPQLPALQKYLSKPSFRQMSRIDAIKNVALAISQVCELFGIDEPREELLRTLSEEVVSEFPDLRGVDIGRGFKMAAKGKLNVDITPYGKEMNLRICFDVLQAYQLHRNRRIKLQIENEKRKALMTAPRNVGQCPEEISKLNDERLKEQEELIKKLAAK